MCLFLQKFDGNIDRSLVVTQVLSPPIVARYIKIHVIRHKGYYAAMRLELHGCPGNILIDKSSNNVETKYGSAERSESFTDTFKV